MGEEAGRGKEKRKVGRWGRRGEGEKRRAEARRKEKWGDGGGGERGRGGGQRQGEGEVMEEEGLRGGRGWHGGE